MAPAALAREVLDFWFGAPGSVEHGQARTVWFRKDEAFDELIRQRFGEAVSIAIAGGFGDWCASAPGALARILLLDQFTRNIFRGTARAFDYDAQALGLTLSGMQSAADAALGVVERIFFYMPLQHAEVTEVQEESVAAYRRLLTEAPGELRPVFAGALRSAENHRAIVEKFGRFPHRNRLLQRPNTPAEDAWLRRGGESFGQ